MTGNFNPFPDWAVFLTRFNKLKQQCNDDPERLADFAQSDRDIGDNCYHLHQTAQAIAKEEARSKRIVHPVMQDFPEAWRDYNKRYVIAVAKASVYAKHNEEVDIEFFPATWEALGWEERWMLANYGAQQFAIAQSAILIILSYVRDDHVEYIFKKLDKESPEASGKPPLPVPSISIMLDTIEFMKNATGTSSHEVFRRHSLLSTIHITQKAGATHSMLEHLEQAQRAFVSGAPLAAAALIRSIMEVVLREHYRTEDGKQDMPTDLKSLINNASDLPSEVNKTRLHDIRKNTNAILHADPRQNPRAKILYDGSDEKIETEIASMFKSLRELIYGIKRPSNRLD